MTALPSLLPIPPTAHAAMSDRVSVNRVYGRSSVTARLPRPSVRFGGAGSHGSRRAEGDRGLSLLPSLLPSGPEMRETER